MAISANRRLPPPWVVCLGGLVAVAAALPALADPLVAPMPQPLQPPLTLDAAVRTALEQNPGIIALHRTTASPRPASWSPAPTPSTRCGKAASATPGRCSRAAANQEPVESTVTLELEVRGRAPSARPRPRPACRRRLGHRRQGADAGRPRRSRFNTVVYRFQKNKLVLDTIDLDQKNVPPRARKLVKAGTLKPVDLIILHTEIDDARACSARAGRPWRRRRATCVPRWASSGRRDSFSRRPDRAAAAGRPGGGAGRGGARRVGRIGAPARRPSPRPTPACAWSGPTASATRSSAPRMNTIIRASTTSVFSSRCRCRS